MQKTSQEIARAFGQVLKKQRLATGFSQEKLAFDAQLDRTFISMLERGLRVPTLGVVLSLSSALNVSASSMVAQVEHAITADSDPNHSRQPFA